MPAHSIVSDDYSPVVHPDNSDSDDFSDIDSDGSDTTVRSMSTLSSLEVSSFFREVYGRAYPADANIPQFVPLDLGEVVRLELQHYYLKLLLESNYVGPVQSILAPDPTSPRRKRVLDIFTADGTWVQEMASEFPHVDFVSLDMIPLVPHKPRANVSFEVYDVYNGFAELDASFDMVHTRRTVSQIRDYHAFLREVDRVLKPGGLLVFGQLEIEVYEYIPPSPTTVSTPPLHRPTIPNSHPLLASCGPVPRLPFVFPSSLPSPHPSPVVLDRTLAPQPHPDPLFDSECIIPAHQSLPIMSQGMSMLRTSLSTQNCSIYMWRDLPTLLLPTSSLWNPDPDPDTLKPPTTPRGYTSIVPQVHILPNSPWHTLSPRLRAIGELVQQIGTSNWQNFGLLFRSQGLSEAETDRLVSAGSAELVSKDIYKVMRYHTVHAIKI
ncbi:methyltransferase domain protein [Ceratobasidium sp. AG-Ba]|nr:methyltransferase domain protein [Ceratobasidium sp. AG-Ba]